MLFNTCHHQFVAALSAAGILSDFFFQQAIGNIDVLNKNTVYVHNQGEEDEPHVIDVIDCLQHISS